MNTYEITCNAIALVKFTVRAESPLAALDLIDTETLPTGGVAGDVAVQYVDWAAEGGAELVSP